jgi:hypothetical protein
MNSLLPIGRHTIDSNGYLILFNLNMNDSANYLCLSENLNSKQIVGLIIFESKKNLIVEEKLLNKD